LRYAGLAVRVSSGDRRDLDWLAEFLGPSFRILKGGAFDYRVDLQHDTATWERVKNQGAHPRRKRIDCFFLDTKIVRHPLWQSGGDESVVFDGEFGVFYIVNRSDAAVTILGANDRWLSRLALMRVVRELAMIHSHQGDSMVLHGAGFQQDRHGVIIAGHKHSGKTSLLIHALGANGTRFVANDRALVSLDPKGARLRGMPTIVTLRPSGLAMFPVLDSRLRSRNYYPVLSLSEARRGMLGRTQLWRNGKFNLSPAQLCDLLRVEPVAHGVLTAILFPRITGAPGTMRLRRLSREWASARLRGNQFRGRSSRKFGGLFARLGESIHPTKSVIAAFSRRLASLVPCYVCELGCDVYNGEFRVETCITGGRQPNAS